MNWKVAFTGKHKSIQAIIYKDNKVFEIRLFKTGYANKTQAVYAVRLANGLIKEKEPEKLPWKQVSLLDFLPPDEVKDLEITQEQLHEQQPKASDI